MDRPRFDPRRLLAGGGTGSSAGRRAVSPPNAWPVKAVSMAAAYGNSAARDALSQKLATVSDASVRFAITRAILHLSPRGDAAAATALDATVAANQKSGQLSGIDELRVAAQQLRARVR